MRVLAQFSLSNTHVHTHTRVGGAIWNGKKKISSVPNKLNLRCQANLWTIFENGSSV